MSIGLQQSLNVSQQMQLVMTPQLQMAIKLLQLSRMELAEMIQQEMEMNPALEEMSHEDDGQENLAGEDPLSQEAEAGTDSEDVREVTMDDNIPADMDWENYINEYNSTGRVHMEIEHTEAPNYEAFTPEKTTLEKHLKWQLMMQEFSDEENNIGELIIGNLNQDGYLSTPLEDICTQAQQPMGIVEKVLGILQGFDPPGVCARNLQETLLIQVAQLGITDKNIINIITNHLKDIENRNSKKIAKALKISVNQVRAAVEMIQRLEPKPGRQFSMEEPTYITPDIFVYKDEDGFKIVMNDDGLPKLRINQFYRNAIARGQKLPKDAKTYLNEKMQSASWLIKSIHQRQKTIYLVMESIIKFQHEFFEKGIAYLKPLILKDIAEDIDMHESTVSRVTTNKYAYTPQGMFELKYFFNSSIERTGGESMASASVKDKIRQLIENEDPSNPLSDEKIAELLQDSQIKIARRTISKYRKVLNILPSSKRKQF